MAKKRHYCSVCGKELIDRCYLRVWSFNDEEVEEDVLCNLEKSGANKDLDSLDGEKLGSNYRELFCGECFKEETKFDDIKYWRESSLFEGNDQDFYGFSLYEYFEILRLKGLDEEFAYRTARRLWKKGMRLLEEDYFDKKERKRISQ